MSVDSAMLPTVDRSPAGLVRRHPLAAFFVLAYAMSWTAWVPYVLSDQGLGVWPFRFPEVAGSGQLLGMVPGNFLGPLAAAVLVTAVTGGRTGLRRWVRGLLRWRVGWRWYLVALAVPIVPLATALLLPGGVQTLTLPSASTLLVLVPVLLIQTATTGLAEEPGWRGFALPRLQAGHGPLPAAVVIGVLWGFWHLPKFFTEWARGGHGVLAVATFVGGVTLSSIVLTWVFNASGGSVPVAMLTHAGGNTVMSVLWAELFPGFGPASVPANLVGNAALAAVLIVATRGMLGARSAGGDLR